MNSPVGLLESENKFKKENDDLTVKNYELRKALEEIVLISKIHEDNKWKKTCKRMAEIAERAIV